MSISRCQKSVECREAILKAQDSNYMDAGIRLGRYLSTVALVLLTASVANAQSIVDGSNLGANHSVYASVVQPDGKIVLGGLFSQLGPGGTGPTNYLRLGRINPDGTLDTSFRPGVANPVNGGVWALALQPDGKILVGGDFTGIGGGTGTTPRANVARLNADGSVDLSFDPGANGRVETFALQRDGKILVGGSFTTIGGGGTGTTSRNKLARLNPDGSLDTSFSTQTDVTVMAILVQADGKIVIGGGFGNVLTGSTQTRRMALARLNQDGSVDSTFTTDAGGGSVYTLVLQPDGKILAGGSFVALIDTVSGELRGRIGRLNADGSIDTSFHPGANNWVTSIAVQADGKIVVGGGFTALGNDATTPRSHIGRLHADGTLDREFNPGADHSVRTIALQSDGRIVAAGEFSTFGSYPRSRIARLTWKGSLDLSFDPNIYGDVFALATQPDGKVLVGGNFLGLGVGAASRLARLNPDGTLDGTFAPAIAGSVHGIAVQRDGKIIITGTFFNVGGVTRNRIARLNSDGTLDATFNAGATHMVYAVALQSDGKILVGGAFTGLTDASGETPRLYIGRFNADGSVDSGFNPGASSWVHALVVQTDGRILVGGQFETIGTVTRKGIARVNLDGSIDPDFDPCAFGAVTAIAVQKDGQIVVGGGFSILGVFMRSNIGRISANGSVDLTFDPGANGSVSALALQTDGKILVSGQFTALGGALQNHVGRLNADGTLDNTLVVGANAVVQPIALQADGQILIGGSFTSITDANGAVPRNRIARVENTGGALQSLSVESCGTNIRWLRSGSGPELTSVSFESASGGGAYVPRGSGNRITGGWQSTSTLTQNQMLHLRARGTIAAGYMTASSSLLDFVKSVYIASPSITPTSLDPATIGSPYAATFTAAVPVGTATFATTGSLPLGMTFVNRVLSGTPRQLGSFPLTITATHSDSGCAGTRNVTLSVVCQPIAVGPLDLNSGTIGMPYESTPLQAKNAIGEPTFAVIDGVLPPGLTLSAAGVLNGTPTARGKWRFTVQASDSNSCNGTQDLAIAIGCPTITLSNTVFAVATRDVAYPATMITQTGGIGGSTFTVSSGALPTGMTLSTTGVVSGTPTAAGTFTFTVTATDANGCTGSRTYELIVVVPTPSLVSVSPSSLNFGAVTTATAAFHCNTSRQPLRVSKTGVAPVTWTATPNQPWIQVSPASGSGSATIQVSICFAAGLPSAGARSGTITFTFTGAMNTVAPVNVSLALYAQGLSTLAQGQIDRPISGTNNVTGSIAITGWAVDDVEVTRVRILRDPVAGEGPNRIFIGNAVLVDGARPDVAANFPSAPFKTRLGWGYLLLTNFLPNRGNGTFTLYAFADDADGHATPLGSTRITCTNDQATRPFGAIDTPRQGETISGTSFANFGWVLSRGTVRADPPGGGTVQVAINGAIVGTPGGWTSRPDLSTLFPVSLYSGVNTALGVYSFNPAQVGDGVHTIAWIVTDNLGAGSGVGSRHFTIFGGATGAQTSVDATSALTGTLPVRDVDALRDEDGALLARRGYDSERPYGAFERDARGRVTIAGEELDRFEVRLGERGEYTGSMRVSAELAPLPIGSRMDGTTFTWAPGAGFLGRYDLVFVRWQDGRPIAKREVRIVLHPKGTGVQAVIDTPRANTTVTAPFVLAGWALDHRAETDSGIDTLHVWAYPVDGSDAIWLGTAAMDGERPDVAALYGEPFRRSGYGLIVHGLAPGIYDLAVFPWSTVTRTFAPARTVRVTVR